MKSKNLAARGHVQPRNLHHNWLIRTKDKDLYVPLVRVR